MNYNPLVPLGEHDSDEDSGQDLSEGGGALLACQVCAREVGRYLCLLCQELACDSCISLAWVPMNAGIDFGINRFGQRQHLYFPEGLAARCANCLAECAQADAVRESGKTEADFVCWPPAPTAWMPTEFPGEDDVPMPHGLMQPRTGPRSSRSMSRSSYRHRDGAPDGP